MNASCPRLVIAGTGSGVGKTSLALGLCRALVRGGMRVQAFKVGPDFLDPTHLAAATGRPCHNLDGWMCGEGYVRRLFAEATQAADIAVIEGVMGLFDGASPAALEGSTAEIARWLDAPVLLVCNAHGVARSLAATVKGFATLEEGVHIAGVVANHCGTSRHTAVLEEALTAAHLPPLIGAVPRGALPELASRHLGLVGADYAADITQTIEALADVVERCLNLPAIAARSQAVEPLPETTTTEPQQPPRRIRLGVARDAAFHFYYDDNLSALQRRGAELVPFSPIADATLPSGIDALYFGGGYPEAHAAALAGNTAMRRDVHAFAASGRCIYAECGGLIYLGRTITDLDGRRHAMTAIVPIDTAMRPTRKVLGYAETEWVEGGPFGAAGLALRGHEFHYSEITADDAASEGWRPAYRVRYRRTADATAAGYRKGRIVAGYVHLHWAAHDNAAENLISFCEQTA